MESNFDIFIDLLTPISLLIIAFLAYKIWKSLANPDTGKRPPGFDKPSDHSLFVKRSSDGKRWLLVRDQTKDELAGPIVVKPGNKITFQIASNESARLHLQFPNDQLFSDLRGIDCFIPKPIEPGTSQTLTIGGNRPIFGSHKYCIVVVTEDDERIETPYVLGGSPPEIIVVHA